MSGNPSQNGWPAVRLGDVTSVGSGAGFPIEYQGATSGRFPFYKVSDMNLPGNEVWMQVHNNAITEQVREELKAKPHPRGTIIFPKIGAAIATNKKRILTKDSCFDNNVIGIHPSPQIDPAFLYHLLLCKDLSDFANTGNPPSIRKTTLEDWQIPLPPLAEQKRIAGILDAADALRAKRRESLAQLDTLLQSTFLDMFGDPRRKGSTGKLPVRPQMLGDLARIRTGKLDANAADDDGLYPFFTCAVSTLRINTPAFDTKAVLVAGNGDLNVKYHEGKFNAYQRTYVIESLDEETLHPRFMHIFLDLYVSELRKQAIGGVIKYIKLPYLKDAVVQLPDLDMQEEFAEFIESVEAQQALQQSHLAELDALFASLQARAFNGEL